MVNSRIVIRGTWDKEPRVNADGTADLLLTNIFESNANKDIRNMSDSVFLVRLSKKAYLRYKKQFKKDDRQIYIVGYVKTALSKKGSPFIYVSPILITFNKIDKLAVSIKKTFEYKYKSIPWWELLEEKDFIEIHHSEIDIVDDKHKNGFLSRLDLRANKNKNLNVAVRKRNDRYELTIGLRSLAIARILNLNVRAYVTDESYEDLVNKFDIDDGNEFQNDSNQ